MSATFEIEAGGEIYTISESLNSDSRELKYLVNHATKGFLFVLHVNDEGIWEIDEEESDPVGDLHPDLVANIGQAIESATT